MKLPSKTIYLIVLGFIAAALVCVIFVQKRNRLLQSSLASGQYEAQYLSVANRLKEQIADMRKKLQGNLSHDLQIPQEKHINKHQDAPADITLVEPPVNICLSGIYLSHIMPLAEINGRLCKIGDRIGSFTLEAIDHYKIRLSDNNGDIQIVQLNTVDEAAQ